MTHDCYSTKRTTVWPQVKDGKPGYAIKYQDGYISWCPEDTFNRDYRAVEGGHLTFGQAIEAMKAGKRVRRLGWNGKGMFVFLEKGSFDGPSRGFQVGTEILHRHPSTQDGIGFGLFRAGEAGSEVRLPHICMRSVTGAIVVGWLASQTDMLAEDWEEVPA
jgi:hypothetical protein